MLKISVYEPLYGFFEKGLLVSFVLHAVIAATLYNYFILKNAPAKAREYGVCSLKI